MSGIVAQNVARPSGLIKAVAAGGGTWVEIKSLTASADGTLDFIDGTDDVVLDSTYPVYCFRFTNIHPATNNVAFSFQGNAAGGSGFNETITSTDFISQHSEDDSATELGYAAANDQADGTAFQTIAQLVGNGNDECASGLLWLFGPSSTSSVKHFYANTNHYRQDDYTREHFTGGYFNTTSAIDEIQFKFSSGNIDDGKIKMFGIKDS